MSDVISPPLWWVYLIQTKDNTLYCGITNDVDRRLRQHERGQGAKYLRGKLPISLVWSLQVGDKQAAAKVEYRIKRLSRIKKQHIVTNIDTFSALKAAFPDWSFLENN